MVWVWEENKMNINYFEQLDKLAQLCSERKYGTAFTHAEQTLKETQKDKSLEGITRRIVLSRLWEYKALCHEQVNDYSKAEEAMEQAVQLNTPDYSQLKRLFDYKRTLYGEYNSKDYGERGNILSRSLRKVKRKKGQREALHTLEKAIASTETIEEKVNGYECLVKYLAAVPKLVIAYGVKALELDCHNHEIKFALSKAFDSEGFGDDAASYLFESAKDLCSEIDLTRVPKSDNFAELH